NFPRFINGIASGPVRLWDLATGAQRLSAPGPSRGRTTVYTDSGRGGPWLLIAGEDGELTLWDPLTGQQRAELRSEPDHFPSWYRGVGVSRDGRLIVADRIDGRGVR